ncbi:MAG: hypothetical protein GWP04_08430, partial [Gammaproteobacteria bacterium]|nr:hypothetical protein [Gammaproteobacteria bacterium]
EAEAELEIEIEADDSQESTSSAVDDSSTTTTTSSSDDSVEDADDSLESEDSPSDQVAPTGGTFPVDEAGVVEIAVSDAGLELISATPNDGFEVSSISTEVDSVEVKFQSGSLEVEFEAELEDGMLYVKVSRDAVEDSSSDDHDSLESDDSTTHDSSSDDSSTEESEDTTPAVDMTKTFTVVTAGSVQISVSGGSLELLDTSLNAGWEIIEMRTETDQIEITFSNGSVEVEFEAEIDNGQLDISIEVNNDNDDEESGSSSSSNS